MNELGSVGRMGQLRKGCWTCKDRKIQCDRGLPTCHKCAKGRRVCGGYAMRLSWPRSNDKKRAITWNPSLTEAHHRQYARPKFINTSTWDMRLHYNLSYPNAALQLPIRQPVRVPWTSAYPGGFKGMDLVQYFYEAAYQSLNTFSSTPSHIRDVIMRMASSEDTISRRALFNALLAVSSLQRHGLHSEAVALKVSALQDLSTSLKGGNMSSVEAAQHITTCMLLCAFEIQLPSESSGEWLWYIRGAMELMQETLVHPQARSTDVGILVDWVYYHDALARFTMHHWRHKSVAVHDSVYGFEKFQQSQRLGVRPPKTRSQNPSHAILNLLCEICDTLSCPSDSKPDEREYQDRLRSLELKVRNLSVTPTAILQQISDAEPPITVELYQLTTLIYLARASENPWTRSENLSSLIDKSFSIARGSSSCHHFFPLFIVACEARTEEQRRIILNVIDKTEGGAHMRSMRVFRSNILSIWVQQDLNADEDLIINYHDIIDTVVSSNSTIPSFT